MRGEVVLEFPVMAVLLSPELLCLPAVPLLLGFAWLHNHLRHAYGYAFLQALQSESKGESQSAAGDVTDSSVGGLLLGGYFLCEWCALSGATLICLNPYLRHSSRAVAGWPNC